jgi:hypothetical protein
LEVGQLVPPIWLSSMEFWYPLPPFINLLINVQFVQSLANPHFVQELTLNGILGSEAMIKLSPGQSL